MTLHRPIITPAEALDIVATDWSWPFAAARRSEIDALFARERARKPALFNGTLLMMRDLRMEGAVLRGDAFKTDYASFFAWHAFGRPADEGVRNVFAMPAVEAADGGFLLGEMAPHTANAGQVYFPCGTPDLDDLRDGRVDLAASAERELLEETGLDVAAFVEADAWTIVENTPQVAVYRRFKARESGEEIVRRVTRHLATDKRPELASVRIVRHHDEIDDRVMPPFVTAFLRHVL